MYDKFDIAEINKADIRDFIPEATGSRASVYCTCPDCGATGKNKGLCVTHKGTMNMAKCFKCGFTLKGPIDAVMFYEHLKFTEAVKFIAERIGFFIESIEEKEKRYKSPQSGHIPFYLQQLYGSGLSEKDVAVTQKDEITQEKVALSPFRPGSVARNGAIITGDDMLIYYYDLYGQPERYLAKNGQEADYVRVRWSKPEQHKSQDGKPIRYQTPTGAKCMLYIPQHIRSLYAKGLPIETLFVTEGEKKAEKACKHGLHAVGIQGIFNIGNDSSGLVSSLSTTITSCKVHNVVLLLDADWNDLSESVTTGSRIDQRPNLFSKAVIKFRDYLKTLHQQGISVDVYFAYVRENEHHDKGIDDLLVGLLKGKEEQILKDVELAMSTHNGQGDYVNIHKITALSDFQIRDFWKLNNHEDFYKAHRDDLKGIESFRIGNVSYTIQDGKLTPFVKCSSEAELWTESFKENGKREINFDYFEALSFIEGNGFFLVPEEYGAPGNYQFAHLEDGIIRHTAEMEIRRFVFDYIKKSTKDKEVITLFISRLGKLLSKDVLERIAISEEDYDKFEKFKQRFYFTNGQVTVTQRQIDFGAIVEPVWEDRLVARSFTRVPIFNILEKSIDGNYVIEITREGLQCEFLHYLINTCNFWGTPRLSGDEKKEYEMHLINKLTAIGYLLNDYKFQTELKAVIAVDGRMSDVGQSNGRSGKSIVGVAISKMCAQAFIDGRNTTNDDQFMYSAVTPRTRNIFLDDALKGFNFEKLFGSITGELAVNPKNKDRFVIPNAKSPKFYITTNHAFPTNSSSTRDRIVFMIFSDWYNEKHSPVDDFGHQLFNDWDDYQWNLFDNLMIECNYLYQKSMSKEWYMTGKGVVPAPMERIELRNYRQRMGEDFLAWAETYFDPSARNINRRCIRKELQENFQCNVPGSFRPVVFKEKLIAFCHFKGYHFNVYARDKDGRNFNDFISKHPQELFEGYMDKSGGVEYFTVAQPAWAITQKFIN